MRPAIPPPRGPASGPAPIVAPRAAPVVKPLAAPSPGNKPLAPATPNGSKVPPSPKPPMASTAGSGLMPKKSAAEPLLDATFGENTYVFVPDADQCYVPAKVVATFKQGDESAEVDVNNRKVTLSKQQTKECMLMDVQSLESIDNMVEFRVLNEASLLHNLRIRYYDDSIYTTIGDILVSVNPFKMVEIYTPDVMDMYIRRKTKSPHVFRVADAAFRAMGETRKAQSCVVAGESGAGKTEATKVFLQYLAEVSLRNEKALGLKKQDDAVSSLQDKILQANPLLEAFGNAKTVRNDNSSRFGKWIEIKFDHGTSIITGGSITSYLLEKTRVVFVADGERNYHIFYQLCAGAGLDKSLRNKYCLSNAATDYYYLNQSSCVNVEEINDARGWHATAKAMEVVGIGGDKAKEVYATLAGILHLGNVNFGTGDKAAVSTSTSSDSLDFAAQCLGFPKADLERALVKRDVSVRGEKIFKDNNPFQAGLQRDGLAKAVYGLLFDWLLNAVNQSLRTKLMEEDNEIRSHNAALMAEWEAAMAAFQANPKKMGTASGPKQPEMKKVKLTSIGVLDIFGFESFVRNSFEQLCINYCNEKLQGHFNSFVFTLEQSVYSAEGLDVSQIDFKDNSVMLECLELKKKGIFALIDEENAMPNGSDASLLKKIMDVNPDLVKKPDMNALRQNSEMANVFIIVHYAGNVGYNIDGFLEKNKDELAPELIALLENSQREFILEVHETSQIEDSERMKKLENSSAANNETKGRRHSTAPTKKQSLGAKFKDQLTLLMTTLNQTSPHFIRCVKPNMEKVPEVFTAPMVLSQLRYSGLLEVCRIRQNGYPVQKAFAEFAFRYGPLCVPPVQKKNDHVGVASALEKQNLIPERKSGMWQIGKTRIFMRQQVFNGLERARDLKLKIFARNMQRVARGFVERRKFRRYNTILGSLKESIKSQTENLIERAILESGSLPYNGIHLPIVQKAHETLAKLKALSKARNLLDEAMAAKELSSIQQALAFADEVGLSKDEPTYTGGKQMAAGIIAEREVKQALRQATQSRSLVEIETQLQRARKCVLVDVSGDVSEAEAMKARLEKVEQVSKQIQQMCTGAAPTASGSAAGDEVMKLVTVLIELGARDHPSVHIGETFAKRQAEVSAAHAKRIADLKANLKHAAGANKLADLIALEVEAVQLGVEKDVDLVEVWQTRTRLEKEKEMETQLENARHALMVKSELPEGVSDSDIAALEQVIAQCLPLLTAKSEALQKSQQLVELTKKQVLAKRKLEQALQLLKDNPNMISEEAIKQAVKDAQSLGMQDETARRGQALLHLKTIAAEEKREMRRRSIMQTSAPLGQNSNRMLTMNDLDEVPEQPWLLADDDDVAGNLSPDMADGDLAPPPGLLKQKRPALTKATDESRKAWIAKRIEAANSTSWNEVLRTSSTDLFKFEHFIGLRSDEDFTEFEPSEMKKKRAQAKCLHTSSEIPKSLLKLDDEWNEEAKKVFKSILGWAGDQNAQFPPTLAVSVLKNGLQMEPLRDEIYVQLLKQLCENPDKESEDRTWLLLCLCTETFGPSKEFLSYLVNFFLRHYSNPGMWGNYAKWCAYQLSATQALGPSKFLPQVKDVNLYTTRPPVIIRVHQIYRVLFEHMTWSDIPVWPDHDVGFVEKLIAEQQKIPVEIVRVSGLFLKDIALVNPNAPGPTTPSISPRERGQRSPSRIQGDLSPPNRGGSVDSSASSASPGPLTPTAQMKKTLLSSLSPRNREPSITLDDSASTDDLPLNRESKRKTLTGVTGKLNALSKSFRLRKGNTVDDSESGGDSFHKSFRVSRSKSFKMKTPAVPSSTAEHGININQSSTTNGSSGNGGGGAGGDAFVAVAGGADGMVSYSNQDDAGESPAITSQQVSRVPPPPFAPWPLPRNFYLGDVFHRLVSQDRLPFLTYQRKMFLNDIQPEKATFIQIMQDVVNNRLPIMDQYQIMDLALTATIRAAVVRAKPVPRTREDLVQHGFFNYIPPNWLYGVQENYWTDAALSFMAAPPGSFLVDMNEAKLYEHYLAICQQQYLFGASLFSVIHKDMPGDFVAAVNYHGLHLLTNDGSPICVGIIGLQEMIKFGASSTFFWVSVNDETVTRLSNLFQSEEDKEKKVLYLHTQQARECYQLLIDYSYWYHHGQVKEF